MMLTGTCFFNIARSYCCRSKPTGEQRQATRRAGRSPGRWQALLPHRQPAIPATRRGLWRRRACHLTYTRSGRCGRACDDWPAHTNTLKRKSEPWSAPRDDSCISFKEPIESWCQMDLFASGYWWLKWITVRLLQLNLIKNYLRKRGNHNRSDLLDIKEAGCCLCATNSIWQELAWDWTVRLRYTNQGR